jgi:hypothetical protein
MNLSPVFETGWAPNLEFSIVKVFDDITQEVTMRCRLSWLTTSALVYEPKCGGRGEVANV